MSFRAGGLSGTELAKCNAFTIIRTSTTSVNKGRVEPMHVKVIIVDEETLAHSRVSVIERVHVEPIKNIHCIVS